VRYGGLKSFGLNEQSKPAYFAPVKPGIMGSLGLWDCALAREAETDRWLDDTGRETDCWLDDRGREADCWLDDRTGD